MKKLSVSFKFIMIVIYYFLNPFINVLAPLDLVLQSKTHFVYDIGITKLSKVKEEE